VAHSKTEVGLEASIVIPTYNKLPLLLRTLEGLERQEGPEGGFEVIVVDDGSSDGTAEALARGNRSYSLTTIRHSANRGRAAARNSGVRAAGGRIIIFLDDDMDTAPGFVQGHLKGHLRIGKVALVGDVRTHPKADHSAVSRYLDTRGAQKIKTRNELPFKYFSTNNSSVGRDHLEAVGLFDESFLSYGFEDVEIALRLSKQLGLKFMFCPDAASLHLHKHTLEDFLRKKVICGESSLKVLLRKHPEVWPELGLSIVERPHFLREPLPLSLKKLGFGILNATRSYEWAEAAVRHLRAYPLTNCLLDYLVLRSYWLGLGKPAQSQTPGAAAAQ
jgi:glycosyltransferase involved in cell wall biosynthesis